MKKMMLLFGILALLGNIANAEIDLVNLESYEEGDIPKPYLGEALVVKSYTTDSGEIVKYITSQGGDATFVIKCELRAKIMYLLKTMS
ncbi:hypothetical protein QUF74_14510 [Candidatus Halobeggiatoa sp. HSG11]|nr:hypothetical protein [Candidatus Halobeggiatoa sp. HSG11]